MTVVACASLIIAVTCSERNFVPVSKARHLMATTTLSFRDADLLRRKLGSVQFFRGYHHRLVRLNMMRGSSSRDDTAMTDAKTSPPVGLYVHIPFCRQRCKYCSFAIVPVGRQRQHSETTSSVSGGFASMMHNYTDAVLRELDSIRATTLPPSVMTLTSVYFGGGTPSLAPVSMLAAILDAIHSIFDVTLDAEITLEVDPGTFDVATVRAWQSLGVNRFSLGVQSFDNDMLARLGRVHRRKDIDEAVSCLIQVYEHKLRYSVDLMSGLPGQSVAQWIETLQTVLSLEPTPPQHLSLYDLQVEANTPFGRWYNDDSRDAGATSSVSRAALPSAAEAALMYKFAAGYLRARGYEHYEVSSYALPLQRSRHNQVYWDVSGQWHAVGLGATSHVHNVRIERPRPLADYVTWVKSAPHDAPRSAAIPEHSLDRLQDILLTRLRTSDGLNMTWIRQEYGATVRRSIHKALELSVDLGLAVHTNDQVRLTDPNGFLYSNTIISSIFAQLDDDGIVGVLMDEPSVAVD